MSESIAVHPCPDCNCDNRIAHAHRLASGHTTYHAHTLDHPLAYSEAHPYTQSEAHPYTQSDAFAITDSDIVIHSNTQS